METLQFKYNPFDVARTLLAIHFDKDLKNFDMSELSHANYKIDYDTPIFITMAIDKMIKTITDQELDTIITSIALDHNISGDFMIDNHYPEIFKRMLKTDRFQEVLQQSYYENPVLHNYVRDKISGKDYHAKYGHHYDTVTAIISLYPELNSIEKQDDFFMNKLMLRGNTNQKDWYQPKTLQSEEIITYEYTLKYYDVQKVFQKCIEDVYQSLETPLSEKQYWHLAYDNYILDKPTQIRTADPNKIIKNLITYGLVEDAEFMCPEFFTDEINSTIDIVEKYIDVDNYADDYELTLFRPIRDNIVNRDELVILTPERMPSHD